jgi:hypothetical protein
MLVSYSSSIPSANVTLVPTLAASDTRLASDRASTVISVNESASDFISVALKLRAFNQFSSFCSSSPFKRLLFTSLYNPLLKQVIHREVPPYGTSLPICDLHLSAYHASISRMHQQTCLVAPFQTARASHLRYRHHHRQIHRCVSWTKTQRQLSQQHSVA